MVKKILLISNFPHIFNRVKTIRYCDGTFDISPTFFKQVYTFHVIINGTNIPLAYALLPNKNQVTYKKVFKMIKSYLKILPESINMDFEKAAMNAAKLVFKCKIYGCFFHLSQSFWRRVQKLGLVKKWYSSEFRNSFKKMQALAFLPVKDTVEGFEILKNSCPPSFNPLLVYLENNYIGKLKKNSLSFRVEPRFPIETWNLHNRVKKNLPRTNNNVEGWHSRIQADTRKHLTVPKVVELFRQEQSLAETDYIKLLNGEKLHIKSKSDKLKDTKLLRLVNEYKSESIDEFLFGIGNNLGSMKLIQKI